MKLSINYNNFVSTIQFIDNSFEYNCIIDVYRSKSIHFEKGCLRSINDIKYIENNHYLYFEEFIAIINLNDFSLTIKIYDDFKEVKYDLRKKCYGNQVGRR